MLTRLAALALVRLGPDGIVQPLPALGRYAMAPPVVLSAHD